MRIFTHRLQPRGRPRWAGALLPGMVGLVVLGIVVLGRGPDAGVQAPGVVGSSVAARFAAVAPGSVPAPLAIADSGTLFVGSRLQTAVLRFSSDGQPLESWGPSLGADSALHDVAGLAVAGDDLFVVDAVDHRIVHLDPTGRPVGTLNFESSGTYGAGALAVDGAGKLYLADTGGNRVLVFGPDGALVSTIGAAGSGAGQIRQPVGLAFAPDGSLYVADLENHRIAWWHADGTFGGAWPTGFSPWGVTVDAQGRVYVPDADGRRVHMYAAQGAEIGEIDERAASGQGLNFPSQTVISRDGSTLWVAGLDGLLKFDLAEEAAPGPVSVPNVASIVVAGLAIAAGLATTFGLRRWWRTPNREQWQRGRTLAVAPPHSTAQHLPSVLLGTAAWSIALALAFVGQFAVASGHPIEDARPYHLAAAGLALLGVWLLERGLNNPTIPAKLEPGGSAGRPAVAAMALGAVLMLSAVPLTIVRLTTGAAAAWVAGLCLLILGAACAKLSLPARIKQSQLQEVTGVVAVTLLAFVLRFVDLANLPPQVHGDEGAVGIEARKLLSGQVQDLFGVGWYELPNLSYAISAASMRVFGDDLFGLRMASVVLGTLTVLVTYLLVRQLFGTRVAMVSAVLLAGAEMHIHYSRIGIIYMQAGCATVLLLYLMLRALRRRRMTDHMLFGLAGGLCLEVYAAARLAPVLVLLYIAHAVLRDRSFVRLHARGLTLAAATGVLFFAPMTVLYAGAPDAFNVRGGEFILGADGLGHELNAYGVNTLNDVIRLQAQRTLEGFLYSGETSDQYGHRAPLVDFWTGALLVVGVGAFALRLRDPRYFLLSTWLWLTLLFGSVLTVDAPFSPHLVGMLPLLAIFPALFLNAGWKTAEYLAGRAGRTLVGGAVAAVAGLALVANARDYTQVHVVLLQPAGFPTVLSAYINEINARYRVYLIGGPDTALGYDTTHFLVPVLDGVDLRDGFVSPSWPASGKGMAFVVEGAMPDFAARLEQLQQFYPSGRTDLHRSSRGDLLFASVVVDP